MKEVLEMSLQYPLIHSFILDDETGLNILHKHPWYLAALSEPMRYLPSFSLAQNSFFQMSDLRISTESSFWYV